MGGKICSNKEEVKQKAGELFPIMASFTPINEKIELKPEHQFLLESIKKQLEVIDPRDKNNLSWYESVKYNLYLYGKLERQRPIGDCLFYTKNQNDNNTPLIIATNINQHYVFGDTTLVVYKNKTVYYGAIKNNIATMPRADGKGILFSPDFIYEGEFRNGIPQGFGRYRSRCMQYVGQFKNGHPLGQGIEKTSNELFIGRIIDEEKRQGFKITNKNQRIKVDSSNISHIVNGKQSILKSFKDHIQKEYAQTLT